MIVETKIQKWGNSLALRVAGMMRDIPGFEDGTLVEVDVSETGFTVRRVENTPKLSKLPYTEEELIAGLDPHTAHADLIPTLLPSELPDYDDEKL